MFIFGKKNIHNYVGGCTNLLRVFCYFFVFALVFFVFSAFAFPCECLFTQLAQYWGTYTYPIGTCTCFYVGGHVCWGFLTCLGFFIVLLNFYNSSTYYYFCHFDRCVLVVEIIPIGTCPPLQFCNGRTGMLGGCV